MGRWLLATAIGGAALAIGTVHTVTLCVVTVTLLASCALTWWDVKDQAFRPRPAATILLTTGVALTAYTALQCVPMPIECLARIAPHNAEVWSRALAPLHEAGPSWAPISLDPPATKVEFLKGVAYLLAFVTALRIARRRTGVAFLSLTVIATGGALAVVSLLHPAFGAHKLYGLFEPSMEVMVNEKHLAPFLNPNNLAAYLNVAFCLALAATLAPEPPIPRPIIAAFAFLLATTQVWVASRAGVATMVAGAMLVFAIGRIARLQDGRKVASASLVTVLAAAAAAFMIALGSSEKVASELFETSTTKFRLLREAVRMVPAYPVFGTGRGAFESTFPEFREAVSYMTFTHPENVVAQWTIEWGVPIGVAGLLALAIGLRPGAVLARSSTATGAWCAIVCVVLQNLVDLGSEIPGLVLAVVICGAIVVGGTAGREPGTWTGKWASAPRALALSAGSIAIYAVVAAALGIRVELSADRRRAYETIPTRQNVDADAVARTFMLRHPAEPYFPFVRGLRAAREDDLNAIRWISATLERARVYGPAHLVLARILSRRSRSQARLEYRLAAMQAPETIGIVVNEASRLVETFDDAQELVPSGGDGRELEELSAKLQSRLPATCARLDATRAIRSWADSGPLLRSARAGVADLESGEDAPWCEGDGRARCRSLTVAATSRAEGLSPGTCEPYALHARAIFAGGDAAGALRELSDATNTIVERVPCLQALWELARRADDEERAREAIDKIVNAGCSEDGECETNLLWAAEAERREGNLRRALSLYERAAERRPEDTGAAELVANLAVSLGMHVEAAEAYGHLSRIDPTNPAWKASAEHERGAAIGSAVRF
jgi:tetratricopeptide (TPR) repeat protein